MSSRLKGVLRVREIQERRARGELGVSRVRHRNAADAEASTWNRLDELSPQPRVAGATVSLPASSLLASRMLTDAGMLAAATQNRVVIDAAAEVDRAAAEWTIAARRVEALDRLSDRLATIEAEERQRMAANEVDDLVLAKFANQLENERGGRQ